MDPESDAWRFADETAKKMNKTIGAYGCDLVPATSVKSATGVTRGEELFHRPELYRPWRGEAKQRTAEALVGKEQEIELLTRKNSELRTETAGLQRELQRALQRAKIAEQGQTEAHERETRKLQETIAELRSQLELQKSSGEHQIRVIRSEHEAEIKQYQAKVKMAQDAANDSGSLYAKQLTEVKAAAAREVALIQQLSQARSAELQNELDATRDGLRRLQERTTELLSDAQNETRRIEERCTNQLREQEVRLDKVRSTLHGEIQILEATAERHRSAAAEATEKAKVAAFELQESEARFKDWNVRLLSDLDQLYEYYYAVVRDIQGGEERVALVRNGEETSPGSLKGVMERVADRLQQLALLKQQHTLASEGLQKKVRQLESASATTSDLFRRTAEEKDVQLSRMYSEVSEAKSRLQRLEKAVAEVQQSVVESGHALQNAAHRLQFFSEDLNTSLTHMGSNPAAPQGVMALVVTHVDGAAVLWETCAPAMQASMSICHDVLRGKLRQFGGYEYSCDGGTLAIAFHDPVAAARFCLESQEWLCRARWPPELLEHHAAREEKANNGTVLFRGLRVGMTMHHGEVETEETNVPTGVGLGRVNYFGKTVTQLLHIASFCSGGQIVLSANAWHAVKDSAYVLDTSTHAELGQHRLSVASRGGARQGDAAFSSTEMVTLHQLLPKSLSGRTFARESTLDTSVSAGGIGIASQFTGVHRAAIGAQVTALRTRQIALSRGTETLSEEMAAVSAAVTSLSCKIRDAQVHGRIYSQADIVAHVAAIDRIVARTDVVRRDVERVGVAYRENMTAIKALEEQVNLQTKVTMSEDEYKKKLDLMNDRSNERLFEYKLQSEHQLQQLRNSLQKAEVTASDLRKQLVAGNKSTTGQTAEAHDTSAHLSKMSVIEVKPAAAAPLSRPKSAAVGRAHTAIADSKRSTSRPKTTSVKPATTH